MKISIITPAYNAANYIDQMIESVLIQKVNLELIIVNDGSKDDTLSICNTYSENYSNVIIINSINFGAGHARNLGIEKATGDFLIFLDSDDLLLYNALTEELMSYLESAAQNDVDIIYTTKCKTDMNLEGRITESIPEKNILDHFPRLEFWTCIYSKDFLLSKNIRFFEYKQQDIESAFRFRAFSAANRIDIKPNIKFILQRDNPNSNTHTFNYYKLFSIKALVYLELLKENKEYYHNQDSLFLTRVVLDCTYNLIKLVEKKGLSTDVNYETIELLVEKVNELHIFKYLKKGKFIQFLKDYYKISIIKFSMKNIEKVSCVDIADDISVETSQQFKLDTTDNILFKLKRIKV